MSYYEEGEELIVLVSAWRLRVGVKRYLGKNVKRLIDRLQPEKVSIWQQSRAGRFDGYSATLLDHQAFVGENSLDSPYPDW